ncbi:MAG TPA: DUF1801 domain-containing protein [Hyphomonadaceae bacterium]|jgi:hypothetical protein|nr:DUF1801 domain-containing protein [Hyphomonadaceae bacterium]
MATKSLKGASKKSAAAKPKTARPKAPASSLAAHPPTGKKVEDASTFLAALDHPLKGDIEAVRKIVLSASPEIADGVKWNSLSFRKSDWFATVNLRSKDVVQLVFHTGAKVKDNPKLDIPDPGGLLLWLAKDRALVTLGAGKTLKANAKAFEAIVKAWMKNV